MPPLEALGLVVLALAAWLWADSLRVREAAVRAARAACEHEGVLLLDDTVAIQSIRPMRDEDGRVRLKRAYVFEYSATGNDRRKGSMALVGERVMVVRLGADG